MRLSLFTKVLLAAALFLIFGVLWSWAAAGVLSIAALLLLGLGGSGESTGRRAGPHASNGGAAAFMAGDGSGCDSGGGFDGGGGGGCDSG